MSAFKASVYDRASDVCIGGVRMYGLLVLYCSEIRRAHLCLSAALGGLWRRVRIFAVRRKASVQARAVSGNALSTVPVL